MTRKQEVEEAEYEEIEQEEEKRYYRKPKKRFTDNQKIIAILSVLLILLIALLVYLVFIGKINFGSLTEKEVDNSNVEIKYSETTEVAEGVVITDVSDVVDNVMPSIVAITSKTLVSTGYYGFFYYGNQEQYQTGAGSGIIIAKTDTELLILTNNHVVEDAEELVVTFIDDENVNATIKGTSSRKDVAVISVKLNDIKSSTLEQIRLATLGSSTNLKVGQGVIAIGNALGYGQSVTTGVVSALNREVTIDNITNKMIQIDAAINGGNSGGALLNSAGQVIGINSAKYSSSGSSSSASVEGMGFAIPISDISELITTLSNGEEESTGGKLGVAGYTITEQMSETYNAPQGFYISQITKGSGAEKAGLEIGNIIIGIDDEEVESYEDLSEYLYNTKAGDTVSVKVAYVSGREYKEKTVKVTLSN